MTQYYGKPAAIDVTLPTHGLFLSGFTQLLLLLLLEVLLLCLSVEGVELGVALGLASLVTLEGALLGLLLLGLLLDLLDVLVPHALNLAQDLGAEVRRRRQLVRQPDEAREYRDKGLVVVVRGQAVPDEDALAGNGFVQSIYCRVQVRNGRRCLFVCGE